MYRYGKRRSVWPRARPLAWCGMRPPVLHQNAYYGIVGRIVEELAPTTEADPAAMLGVLLVMAGNAVNRGPHAAVGAVEHPGREWLVVVGDTSRARKGTAYAEARRIMLAADPGWGDRILGGFGSGEGVVAAVADATDDEPAVVDRRLLVREAEFARVLRTASREGSILSMILREAFDGDRLAVRTKRSVITSTGAHISVVADTTGTELRETLNSTEIANGLANRFLFFHASSRATAARRWRAFYAARR